MKNWTVNEDVYSCWTRLYSIATLGGWNPAPLGLLKKTSGVTKAFLEHPKWCTPPLPYPTESLGFLWEGTWQHAQRCCSVGVPMVGEILASTFGSFTSRERSHIHTKTTGSLETHHLHKCWLVVGHVSFQDILLTQEGQSFAPAASRSAKGLTSIMGPAPPWLKLLGEGGVKLWSRGAWRILVYLLETKTLHLKGCQKSYKSIISWTLRTNHPFSDRFFRNYFWSGDIFFILVFKFLWEWGFFLGVWSLITR